MQSEENRGTEIQIARLATAIRNFVLSRIHDRGAAEDVSQEVLLRISRSIPSLIRADRFDAWAFQIARNAVSDYFRSAEAIEQFNDELHPDAIEHPDPVLLAEEKAMRLELASYVRSEIEMLPPIYREALLLIEYQRIPQTDLAKSLGLSLSTVKSRVQRGRRILRSRMEKCCSWTFDRYGTVLEAVPKTRMQSGQCEGCKDSC